MAKNDMAKSLEARKTQRHAAAAFTALEAEEAAPVKRTYTDAEKAEAQKELDRLDAEIKKEKKQRTSGNFMYIDFKGLKDYIRYRAKAEGVTMNEFIYALVSQDFDEHGNEYKAAKKAQLEAELAALEVR